MAKILIVEDDEKIAWLEKDYLESNGYETDIIDDGRKVIQVLQEKNYDLVLLDLMLPGLDGYAICRKIRDEIDIPILMVTARAEAVDVIRGLGLGADDYITKPFDPSQLVARVRAHLKRYERLTGRRENAHKSSDENGKLKIQDVVVETKTWNVRSAFQTGSLSCSAFWRKTLILFFQKRSCLKRSGDLITFLMRLQCLSISTV